MAMQRAGLSGNYGRRGFTMVELLTVIAIIAILAGILFPVFATVRKNVHKATCSSNLHSIAVALKLYKDDHGAYPEALDGFYTAGTGGGQSTEVTFLWPQYVKEKQIFRCPLSPYKIDSDKSPPQALNPIQGDRFRQYPNRAYPVWDSYDGQFEPGNLPSAPYVVKYLRHWSGANTGYGDNPRQLLYKNPPEDTVVTWCTYHRDWDRSGNQAQPQTGSIDLVLFLDGHVKPTPSNLMSPIQTVSVNPPHSFLVGRGD
jgi:prepilin-type N-terminal cleavage/methylation domain-containing protein